MSPETPPPLDKLLMSVPFQRCRHVAARTVDDVAVMRWATRVARGEVPAE